jgi:dienelactone hydrolase
MNRALILCAVAIAASCALTACDDGEGTDGDADVDSDGDADADGDGDVDGDGDADTDGDVDGDGDGDGDGDVDTDGDTDTDVDGDSDRDSDHDIPGPCGECPEEMVCHPDLGRCVPDCRVAGCPPWVPVCDEETGLCTPGAPVETDSEELDVTNPTSGNVWWVKAYFPRDAGPDRRYPAIVLVPGGSGAGSEMESTPGRSPANYAARGWVAVAFDADGRGHTPGTEDYCGHTHQDGLRAVIDAVAALPYVDRERIGVNTGSYGITMGSGVLARYPALPVRFLVDFEGPADRNDTGHCDASDTGHITHDCDDDAWWAEREAASFIMRVQVPYLRLQNVRDHVQPDNLHCILMINNATDDAYGGRGMSPWTRVNGADMNEPNTTYSADSPPVYNEGSGSIDVVAFWNEMLDL